MRRKSTRNAAKSSPEKSVETPSRRSRRQSKRRKRSTSDSSQEDSDDAPLSQAIQKPTVTTVNENPNPDDDGDQVWSVKPAPSDAPEGEIQKLKICLTRPTISSPEKIQSELSPVGRRRRNKSTSNQEEDVTSSEDVVSARKSRHRGKITDEQEIDDQEDKKGKGKSKTKNKSKHEKSQELEQDINYETQSEISENVQVTPQSPQAAIDIRVDNENVSNNECEMVINQESNSVSQSSEISDTTIEEINVSVPPESVKDNETLQCIPEKGADLPQLTKAIEEPLQEIKDDTSQSVSTFEIEVKNSPPQLEVQNLVLEPEPILELEVEQTSVVEHEQVIEQHVIKSEQDVETEQPLTETAAVTEIVSSDEQISNAEPAEKDDHYENEVADVVCSEEEVKEIFQEVASEIGQSSEETNEEKQESDDSRDNETEEVSEKPQASPKYLQENENIEAKKPELNNCTQNIELDSREEPTLVDTSSEVQDNEKEIASVQKQESTSDDTVSCEETVSNTTTATTSIVSTKSINLDRSFSSNDEQITGKIRKRKWGNSQIGLQLIKPLINNIDVAIIKQFCPNLELLQESEVKFEPLIATRRVSDSEKRLNFNQTEDRVRLTSQTSVNSTSDSGLDKDNNEENKLNIIAMNRKISIVDDTASKLKPPPSPAKNPLSQVLFITNLVRPFTLKQLKELLERTGKITENGFWTDRIKSKCYVCYESVEEAEATRNALHGVNWPIGNGKKLIIDYSTNEDLEKARNPAPPPPPPVETQQKIVEQQDISHIQHQLKQRKMSDDNINERNTHKTETPVREWDIGKEDLHRRSRSRERVGHNDRMDRNERRKHKRSPTPLEDLINKKFVKNEEEPPQKLMDDLFVKTQAMPSIYWLPLTPEEIATKQQQRLLRMAEHKRRMEESSRNRGDYGGRGAPYRRRYD